MRKRLLCAAVAAALLPLTVQAQNAPGNGNGGKPVTQINAVSVSAALDRARNSLSPETGSSQYVIDAKAIAQLPQGDSTPLNQVLLQAPGVVQDSFGQMHVRGDHANLQYRVNGVLIPESIGGFGQTLDTRLIQNVKLLDGALPAQYGDRTAAVVDITTKSGHALGNGGDIGVTGGSFGTINPFVSLFGSSGRWSYFFTANYLKNEAGIENPTASRKPIHDDTHQVKGFGDLSYLINADTRLSFMFGITNNRFQIPNNPGQDPSFAYMDRTQFNSADLNENQQEKTRFGILSLQGKLGDSAYQVSLGQRYSSIDFAPDTVGDLMFNGIAADIGRSNRADTLQLDVSTPLGQNHTLRYGIYQQFENAGSSNHALVFPADADGNQTSTTPIAIYDGSSLEARTSAAYLQDEWDVSENWTINYGLRGDQYSMGSRTESQLSPRLGVVWQATDNTTVHAGYARYFTPPATELIARSDIHKFDGTTNAIADVGNILPLSERADYYDLGIQQQVTPNLTVGLDNYVRNVRRLQDEGQFGAALIFSTFNFDQGKIRGNELSVNYDNGTFNAYFNVAYNKAMGKRVITGQYNFQPDDLSYIYSNWIHLDHDQKITSSGGIGYHFADGTRIGADYLFGSGLRRDGAVPNGDHMPAYMQVNLSVSHDFHFAGTGKLHTQLALINAFDRTYEIRDGSGIGVGAPQFGPRRGLYLTVAKHF
ncbi:TonB-dependent receptor [Oleiagrimonas sp. C23AA]|uniref:TonB-dependent receptor n=1 Tax=Oleiagrimonas sp. C23AA TaxID=2719047 RepID=UPI001424A1EE|nr:TonB-dependent receptor [Oleiagrimonas sp. C23AA]NII10191.1 TonB-dependent receptor [Oleiagrimonas sp. C23AA]